MPTTASKDNRYRCHRRLSFLLIGTAVILSALGLFAVVAGPTRKVGTPLDVFMPCVFLWVVAVLYAIAQFNYAITVFEDKLVISSLGWRGVVTEEIAFQDIASFKVAESKFGPVLIMELSNGRTVSTRSDLADFAGMCKSVEFHSGKPGFLPPWMPA